MKSVALTAIIAAFVSAQNNSTIAGQLKSTLCDQNIQTCKLSCGGQTEPVTNICDPNTLAWNCVCPSGTNQTIADVAFPVAYAGCQSDQAQCVAGCSANQLAGDQKANSCYDDCKKKIMCSGPNAQAPKGKMQKSNSTGAGGNNSSGASQISVFVSGLVGMLALSLL